MLFRGGHGRFNGGARGISNDDIKKREWLVVRSTNSLWGTGPPFPSPVYVWDQTKPRWGLKSAHHVLLLYLFVLYSFLTLYDSQNYEDYQ